MRKRPKEPKHRSRGLWLVLVVGLPIVGATAIWSLRPVPGGREGAAPAVSPPSAPSHTTHWTLPPGFKKARHYRVYLAEPPAGTKLSFDYSGTGSLSQVVWSPAPTPGARWETRLAGETENEAAVPFSSNGPYYVLEQYVPKDDRSTGVSGHRWWAYYEIMNGGYDWNQPLGTYSAIGQVEEEDLPGPSWSVRVLEAEREVSAFKVTLDGTKDERGERDERGARLFPAAGLPADPDGRRRFYLEFFARHSGQLRMERGGR